MHARFNGVSEAGILALVALGDKGALTPANVVEVARPADHPLHDRFTWDDTKAAQLRRLDEARALIRSVRIELTQETIFIRVPRFVHDPANGKNAGYVETLSLRDDVDRARAVVQQELYRAVSALRRANNVAAALGLRQELSTLIAEVARVAETVPNAKEEA